MTPEEYEIRLLSQSAAGRETLRVVRQTRSQMTGSQRLETAFELTEITRQIMRSGIQAQNPNLDDAAIQERYVDRLLRLNGVSRDWIQSRQKETASD